MRRKYRYKLLSYIKTQRIPYTTYRDKGRINVLIDLKNLSDTHKTWVFNLLRKLNA